LEIKKNKLTFATPIQKENCEVKIKCESSSVGRASPCQGEGRGFESRLSLNFIIVKYFVIILTFYRSGGMVDTQDLKSCGSNAVRVQVPPSIHLFMRK
jgi:hypothetical protein